MLENSNVFLAPVHSYLNPGIVFTYDYSTRGYEEKKRTKHVNLGTTYTILQARLISDYLAGKKSLRTRISTTTSQPFN